MPFLTKGKTNWKYILIVVILAVIVGGGTLWYAKSSEKPYQLIEIKKSEKVSFEQLSTCNIDSDCILVSHKSCGGMIKISINKKYESLYNSTPKFQDSTGEICKTRGISYDEQKQIIEGQTPMESLCLNGKCRPKYVEETANWKTYRNEEYGFEIKYPDGLSPKVYPSSLVDFSGVINLYIHGFPEKYAVSIQISICPGCYSSVENWINSLGTIEEGKEIIYQEELKSVISKEKIKIGGQEGYKIITPSGAFIGLVKNNTLYEIHQPYPVECRLGECEILYQMLSTFRFLE
jgi:hypothetical protein